MSKLDSDGEKNLKRLGLFIYLLPVVGFFPAVWTVYRRQGSKQEQAVSRLAITLALIWLSGYFLLETGARSTEFLQVPLLITSSILTSSYFLLNIGLMIRLVARKPLWLPGISKISDRLP